MADRQVHGVRDSGRRHQGNRLSFVDGDEGQDSRPQRRVPLRHRCRRPEEEDPGRRRLCPFARSRSRAAVMDMTGHVEQNKQWRYGQVRERQAEVWACLQGVTDPELDESVTELNFVTRAEVDPENRVHIEFRLPTYWCAANFWALISDDMRRAVG